MFKTEKVSANIFMKWSLQILSRFFNNFLHLALLVKKSLLCWLYLIEKTPRRKRSHFTVPWWDNIFLVNIHAERINIFFFSLFSYPFPYYKLHWNWSIWNINWSFSTFLLLHVHQTSGHIFVSLSWTVIKNKCNFNWLWVLSFGVFLG